MTTASFISVVVGIDGLAFIPYFPRRLPVGAVGGAVTSHHLVYAPSYGAAPSRRYYPRRAMLALLYPLFPRANTLSTSSISVSPSHLLGSSFSSSVPCFPKAPVTGVLGLAKSIVCSRFVRCLQCRPVTAVFLFVRCFPFSAGVHVFLSVPPPPPFRGAQNPLISRLFHPSSCPYPSDNTFWAVPHLGVTPCVLSGSSGLRCGALLDGMLCYVPCLGVPGAGCRF